MATITVPASPALERVLSIEIARVTERAAVAAASPSLAQDWPNRTVKVIVPYGPQGSRSGQPVSAL